jgi:hypothetical protein
MEIMPVGENQSVLPTNPGSDVNNKDARKKGKVVQRNYVMNDLGALRKKLKHEGRKKEYIIAKEAKDASNTVMKL